MPYVKKGLGPTLERNYEKVIFCVAIVFLAFTVYSYYNGETERKVESQNFDGQIAQKLNSLNNEVPPVETNRFSRIGKTLSTPFLVSTNKLFLVAQERVKCFKCKRPIPYEALKCDFCGEEQPNQDGFVKGSDSDGDGIPDEYETKYKAFLNRHDPNDAVLDFDNDGFTNLEEFQAGTDPGDPKSHPSRVVFLRVHAMEEARIGYSLRGANETSPGKYKFQIKNNNSGQDFYVALDGEIEDSNSPDGTKYKVVSVETIEELRMKAGYSTPRPVKVYIATISNGTLQYKLKEGDPYGTSGDVLVTFLCTRDAESREYLGQINQTFSFDDEVYTVLKVDRKQGSALIRRNSDQKEFEVRRE